MKSSIYLIALGYFTFSLAFCRDQPDKKQVRQSTNSDSLQIVLSLLETDSLNPVLWKKQYQLLLDKKDTSNALFSLRRYNYLAPEDGDGWLEMAWLLAERKDRGALIITDSLALVKDDMIRTRARYIRGIYYSNLQNEEQAIREFDSTIVHNYTFTDAYIEKGIIQYNQHKYDAALKTFQQAFKISNNNAELYYWIGKSYEGMGDKNEAADWQKKYEALK